MDSAVVYAGSIRIRHKDVHGTFRNTFSCSFWKKCKYKLSPSQCLLDCQCVCEGGWFERCTYCVQCKRVNQCIAYPTCKEIYPSSTQSSKPKLIGLFLLKRGKKDLRALATNFANSFGKCHWPWRWDWLYQTGQEQFYIICPNSLFSAKCQCTINVQWGQAKTTRQYYARTHARA